MQHISQFAARAPRPVQAPPPGALSAPLLLGDVTRQLWPNTATAPLALDLDARRRHIYVTGQTGTGKSTLLASMIAQDIAAGRGLAILDPHGSLAADALGAIPPHRFKDVVYFDPLDPRPIGFNVLAGVTPRTAPRLAETIVTCFLHIWSETAIGDASQDLLRNCLRALMDTQQTTLLGVRRMIDDPDYRQRIAVRISDPEVRHYWHVTVPNYSERTWEDVTRPLLNKLRRLFGDYRVRNVIGQASSSIDLRSIMDRSKILIVNLNIGQLDEGIAHLLGALLSASLTSAAFARGDVAESERVPFIFYVDEFQKFANTAFIDILSESRKYGLLLVLAHQYLAQLPDDLRSGVLGNVGVSIAFRVGAEDAKVLSLHLGLDERYREAQFKGHEQILNLPNYEAYIKMLVDGAPETHKLAPYPARPAINLRPQSVMALSRQHNGRDRDRVEFEIAKFYRTP